MRVLVRVLRLLVVLWVVSLATFLMLELVPGDPASAVLGPAGTPEQYAEVRHELGLDRPVLERYSDWLGDVVRGDLGDSLVPPTQTVSAAIGRRLPVTLEIAVLASLMALAGSVPAAMWSAQHAGGRLDRFLSALSFATFSLPSFLIGLLLIFACVFHPGVARVVLGLVGAAALVAGGLGLVRRRSGDAGGAGAGDLARAAPRLVLALAAVIVALAWFPDLPRQDFVRLSSGGLRENLRHAFLPALTVALTEMAVFTRLLRSDMITTLQSDFVLSARAKGMPTGYVLRRHALRPSSVSLLTLAGVSLGRLIGGTVIVEALFSLPGMGRLIVEAISTRNYTMVQGAVLVLVAINVGVNALVDGLYGVIDPRIRRGRA